MPKSTALLTFALASLILVVIPGPSVLFVVGRSLSLGRRGGVLSAVGNELGILPLVAAVAFGVGTVVAKSLVVFEIVKLLGAAYLIYLGVQVHRPPSSWSMLRQGFFVGVTNPKTIVFFVAVLPQFTDVHSGSVSAQMLVLGVVFALIALICDSTWALIAGTARAWFARSPKRLRTIRATGGGMMIALGGTLAASGNTA